MGLNHIIKLPDIGEGTAQAEIARWHVSPGQIIKEDEPLVDMTTEKATVEIPSPVTGVVLSLGGGPGDMIAVGAELAVLDVSTIPAGDAPIHNPISQITLEQKTPAPPKLAPPSVVPAVQAVTIAPSVAPPAKTPASAREIPLASPAVRKRARDFGIELHVVPGTGPKGRILREDLDAYIGAAHTPRHSTHPSSEPEVTIVKVMGMRRVIAERMVEATRHIPHFSYIEEIDVTAVENLRAHLNARHAAARGKLTLLPFLLRALTCALANYRQMNARFDDTAGEVQQFKSVHVGIATQTDAGLMVPVLRDAHHANLWDTAKEISRLAAACRGGKARREELSGSTITISSLGALGGLATTPIINYPEVAILGPNRIVERPVVHNGQIAIRKMMNLSGSFDHRVVDGQEAALFIGEIKKLLECPALIFVETN